MSLSFTSFAVTFSSFIIMLILFRKYTNILILLSLLSTLILSVFILNLANIDEIILFLNHNFIVNINLQFKLIGAIFLLVAFTASLYGISTNKKLEMIIGNVYCLASLICLFAGDFISLFVSLEFMMLAATMLIFISNRQDSIYASKFYFLTHLTSSSFILLGISYIIAKTGTTEIKLLTQSINYHNPGFFFYMLIFIGCLINIACIPFAGWIINCYPSTSNTSLIYLITFTTKISLVIIIKLFAGFEALKFFGITMMLYGAIYACIEENLKRILCYLTISQLGFILILIGIGSAASISFVYSYIIIHIVYTTLITLLLGILHEVNIETSWQIKRIKNYYVKIALLIGILTVINFPFTSIFMLKLQLSNILDSSHYYLLYFTNVILFLAIPFREYFNIKELIKIKVTIFSLFTIIIAIVTLIITTTHLVTNIKHQFNNELNIITESIKQLILITIGVILAFTVKIRRKSTLDINFDIAGFLDNNIRTITHNDKEEPESLIDSDKLIYENITKSTLDKISIIHNQQSAIFIVFSMLIIVLIVSLNL